MDRHAAQPRCIDLAVFSGIRGSGVGLLWGFFSSLSDSKELPKMERIRYVGRATGTNFGLFALFLGGYSGLACAFERTRRRDDVWNSVAAGALVGMMVALPYRPTPRSLALSAATTGAIAAVLHGIIK
eukprot:comp5721_c0_seq1/m.1587 comp5721_c0_seq1/g.1587  ORF comp5721_c0_seq1/g.1587 comp5721_c0_seq1/m.1587 type:complete len:128 (-) comp5721_c0_seq1:134-517(-)